MKKSFTYPAIFEQDPDLKDESVSIRFPDLPGCYSSGDNYQDAVFMASEALEIMLEWLIEDGKPLPTPGMVKENLSSCESLVEISAEVGVPDETESGE